MEERPIVYLVGAGPGDPGLITLKGLQCIKKADVIVYDRLAGKRLLNYARPDCEIIYVGKSPDCHVLHQDDINRVLINKAREHKIVTRLKGGDPFVFGRGGEECLALADNGIPFEIVPGITSAIAVPAYAGIPVTQRGLTSTVAILTGNEEPGKDSSQIEWDKIATGVGTLVFLMGMANLPHIVARLTANGLPLSTPVAIIRWGTRPEQQTMIGTLHDIAERAKAAGFKNPSVIIVGEVVNLREQLRWFEKKPLFGRRIVVTRARSQASRFAELIDQLGGEPWEVPTIEIVPPADLGPLDAAIAQAEGYDWIIFTSVNGVEFFFRRFRELERDIRDLKGARMCAIGPATRQELTKYGLNVDLTPAEFVAEAIIEALRNYGVTGRKFLLPRADIARKILPEQLRKMGAEVDEVDAYRTIPGAGNVTELRDMINEGQIHAITFTSSSTVKNFIAKLNGADPVELLQGVTVASIGPVTSRTAREMGLQVDIEAPEYTIPGLIKALVDYFQEGGAKK